jgi:flavin reductase (DIM6/NTAB) family NADH-FMN oxidoreductase RutF
MSLNQALWKKALTESYQAIERLSGVFLVTQGKERKPNIMTIGWMQGGIIWGRPIISVLVRPSRFSFIHIEENPSFTVCVPTDNMKREINWCGSVSGATVDKFKSTAFTPIYNEDFSVPIIKECPIHFECTIVQKTKVIETNFIPEILREYYSSGDFHSVYYGEITRVKI